MWGEDKSTFQKGRWKHTVLNWIVFVGLIAVLFLLSPGAHGISSLRRAQGTRTRFPQRSRCAQCPTKVTVLDGQVGETSVHSAAAGASPLGSEGGGVQGSNGEQNRPVTEFRAAMVSRTGLSLSSGRRR